MDLKNKNIVNLINPAEVNTMSILLFMYSFVPAAFVAKTLEAALIYVLLIFIYYILIYLVSELIKVTVKEELKFIIVPLTFIALTVLVGQLASAFFVNFAKDYLTYIYLMSVSSLPYMLALDNKEKKFGQGMVHTLQTVISFAIIFIVIAILREVLGTGMIVFGKYTGLTLSVDFFSKYAMTVLQNPLGSLLILGFIMALLNRKVVKS